MGGKYDLKGFVEFDRGDGRISEKAIVTCTALRIIGFNKKICRDFIREDDRYAKLFFNPDTRVVGIKLMPEPEDNAYMLHRGTPSNYTSVTAWAFFDYWKIDHSVTRQFEAEHDETKHMIFFDMNKPIREGTRAIRKTELQIEPKRAKR